MPYKLLSVAFIDAVVTTVDLCVVSLRLNHSKSAVGVYTKINDIVRTWKVATPRHMNLVIAIFLSVFVYVVSFHNQLRIL